LERHACPKQEVSLRFYASLPRASLLQGNAATGARWPNSFSFLRLQGAQTLAPKPDSSDSLRPDFTSGFIGAIANGRAENRQEPQAIHFLILI